MVLVHLDVVFKRGNWNDRTLKLICKYLKLREEIFEGINFREFFFGYFAGIDYRELGLAEDFAGIYFRELSLTKISREQIFAKALSTKISRE